MKLIIAGSRNLLAHIQKNNDRLLGYRLTQTDLMQRMDQIVASAVRASGWAVEITEFVSGHYGDVDLAGERYARRLGLEPKLFPPDWDKWGLAAGPIRNGEMAAYADKLLLIWDGQSRGSLDMQSKMLRANKPIYSKII